MLHCAIGARGARVWGAVMSNSNLRGVTIGVLSAALGDRYATAVLTGISEAARARGAGVVTFAGGQLEPEDRRRKTPNVVYDLASTDQLDGLIVLAGSLVNEVGLERLTAFVSQFSPLPCVSVAVTLPGAASVLVDADHGIRAALEHLMEMHGRHRIAFIRGPDGNDEAARRFRVYEEVFADFRVKVDPQLVAPGAFTAASGAAAIETLLDKRKVRIDAVVAANDVMAIAALEALRVRGVRVPRDVSVIGFDDVEEASWSSPTLTTVRQPLERQGQVAVDMLLDRIAGRAPSARAMLPTQIVVRESCGCVLGRLRVSSSARSREHGPESEREPRAALLVAIQGVVDPADVAGVSLLVEAFLDELFGKGGHFFDALSGALSGRSARAVEVPPLQAAIGVLRRTAVPMLDAARAAKAEDLLVRAHLEVAALAERVQARRRLSAQRIAHLLSRLGQAFLVADDERGIAQALANLLPELPIERCQLVVYERGELAEMPPTSALRLLEYTRSNVDLVPVKLRARELVSPASILGEAAQSWVVQPLVHRGVHLGHLVLESAPRHGFLHEELRELVAHALQSVRYRKGAGLWSGTAVTRP